MSNTPSDKSVASVNRRWRGASILIVIAIIIQAFRILTVTASNGETPFLSANDRSRWCTIASLIEDQSFVIDRLNDIRDSSGKSRTWYSIDMVRKPEADGTEHYYSSKPPLLSVLYACVCSPLTVVLNRRLSAEPLMVGRSFLLIVNLLPLALLWFAFAGWIRRSVDDTWSRWVLLIIVLFGTFLSTFNNTLNNHFPAAFCMIASLWCLECLLEGPSHSISTYLALGFFAALTAAFELPALAWLCMVVGLVGLRLGIQSAVLTASGGLPVAIAFAITNFIAYGDLQPPYAHREVLGPQLAIVKSTQVLSASDTPLIADLRAMIAEAKLPIAEPLALRSARRAQTWELSGTHPQHSEQKTRLALVPTKDGFAVHRWNDWYDYPKSYWLPENKRGVDLGEPSRMKYAFHVLIGHHGVFSLTPFWLVSLVGSVVLLSRTGSNHRWWLGVAITLVSFVCIAFYLTRPLIDRNYGGVCSGFRWSFWLAPAWIWLAVPGLEAIRRSFWGRWLVMIAVAISIYSATYPCVSTDARPANPWQHPWIYTWTLAK